MGMSGQRHAPAALYPFRYPLGGPPSRSGRRDIKIDLRELGVGDVDWFHLAQDRDRWRALVNTVMNIRVP
jgi:hypothetical protein